MRPRAARCALGQQWLLTPCRLTPAVELAVGQALLPSSFLCSSSSSPLHPRRTPPSGPASRCPTGEEGGSVREAGLFSLLSWRLPLSMPALACATRCLSPCLRLRASSLLEQLPGRRHPCGPQQRSARLGAASGHRVAAGRQRGPLARRPRRPGLQARVGPPSETLHGPLSPRKQGRGRQRAAALTRAVVLDAPPSSPPLTQERRARGACLCGAPGRREHPRRPRDHRRSDRAGRRCGGAGQRCVGWRAG